MTVKGQEFSELVRRMSDGEADTEISKELGRLLVELREQAELRGTHVKGAIKLTVTFACNPKGMLDIGHKIDTKRPSKSSLPTTAWATKQGGVSFDMPRQTKLPLVDVDAPRVVMDVDTDEDDADDVRRH
jgi:hypothetical protein